MSEKKDYQKFRKGIWSPRDRIERVENILVIGMPDVNCCINGVESWIEIKSPTEPKRQTTKLFGSNHKLSQEQMNWFKTQIDAGGYCWVLIITNHRWMIIHGKHADDINNLTISQLVEISSWNKIVPVTKADFNELRKIIGGNNG